MSRYIRTALLVLLINFVGLTDTRAQEPPVKDDKVLLTRVFLCKGIGSALSLVRAFSKSDDVGWQRFSIEHGRSHRYQWDATPAEHGVCVFEDYVFGRLLQSISINTKVIHMTDQEFAVFRAYGSFKMTRDDGPYFVFSAPSRPPHYGPVTAIDRPLRSWGTLFAAR